MTKSKRPWKGIFLLAVSAYDRSRLLTFIASGLLLCAPVVTAQIQFVDVTPGSGMEREGESYGASWGDLNADGWVDLFVSNHRNPTSLFVNMGNGTFVNRNLEVGTWAAYPLLDQHGGSWGDFNNDGYQDLMVSLGATDDLQFLVNQNGVLFDQVVDYGLDAYTSWPGRLPVWLDYDADGWLDFVMMLRGYPKIFRQDAGTFVPTKTEVGMSCQNSQYGQLVDINGDGVLDLICDNQTLWPNRIYDTTTIPFTDITSLVPQVGAVNDTAVGDFDNNLRNDIFEVRGVFRVSEAVLVDADSIEAQLIVDSGAEEYMRFQTAGILSILLDWNRRDKNHIFIGAAGVHPDNFGPEDRIEFDLDSADPAVQGIMPHDPALDDGLWIGYDEVEGYWEIQVSSGLLLNITYWFIDASSTISDLTVGGFSSGDLPVNSKLMMNYGTGFVEEADSRGVGAPISCVSTVAADFDNDMDQDIYVVCRGGVSNIANIMYENLGNGNFQVLAGAGGAAGPTGVGTGTGETAVIADYDTDGFLDLFVTNGLNIYPEEPLHESRGGADFLYRNVGNANAWIELDLVGSLANRDGIGAKVYATAGGVTQLREQNGGYHRWSQNHQRIHFGLGANTAVDLTIEWPSGVVDTVTDVPVNKLYKVTESGGYEEVILGEVVPSECGEPAVDSAVDFGFYIYKDCVTDAWHVLTTSGNSYSLHIGSITSSLPLVAVAQIDIEAHDVFDNSDATIINFGLQTWGTGRDEFSFQVQDGAQVCLTFESPAALATVNLGSAQVPIAVPFDLETLGVCTNLPVDISIDDVTVDETAGTATFAVTLAETSSQTVTVDYTTLDGTAVEPGDYAMAAGTLTFLPGDLSEPIVVTINDDLEGEIDESFVVQLSNPVNGILIKSDGVATITDDEISACSDPLVDGASDNGLFAWKDCGTGLWHIASAAGGSYSLFIGSVVAEQPLTSVMPVDIEGHDLFDNSVPETIEFGIQTWGTGIDEFVFAVPAGSAACLSLDSPSSYSVLVGGDRVPYPVPVDLSTLGACTNLAAAISVADVVVDENAGVAEFTVTLAEASTLEVMVDYATVDGLATAPGDYISASDTLTFAAGDVSKSVSISIIDDMAGESDEDFSLLLSNPVNGELIKSSGLATIVDDEISACDEPTVDGSVDAAIFAWQDCQTGVWHIKSTAGGTYANYAGNLTSTQPFANLTAVDIEGHDTLDNTVTDTIEFIMQIWGNGYDEFTFTAAPGAAVCLSLDVPQNVLVGAGRDAYALPLDLSTLTECTNLPAEISIDDVMIDETAGVANFSVTLGEASAQTVMVDYVTADDTATQPDDYLAVSDTLTFEPGDVLMQVTVTIIDDALGEGDEGFTVQLSNAVEGIIIAGTGTGTIQDNEVSPCGAPVFDSGVEAELFLWKDCGANVWHVQATGGGVYSNHVGQLTSGQAFQSVTPLDIEGHDTFDTSIPAAISFGLQKWNNGVDAFSFGLVSGESACIALDAPVGADIFYGPDRAQVAPPFEIGTLGVCPL